LLAAFYQIIEIWNWGIGASRCLIGMNAITIYMAKQYIGFRAWPRAWPRGREELSRCAYAAGAGDLFISAWRGLGSGWCHFLIEKRSFCGFEQQDIEVLTAPKQTVIFAHPAIDVG